MRVNPTVLLQFSLLSFASVVARYLDNTPTFQGSATTHCLDSHPNWQTRGMSDKESASYGDDPHMEAPPLGTPQTLAACGANGAPMYTEDEVPERFVIGCCGDMKEATRRWKETYKWRKENKVDEIIDTPQPHFHQCRQVFPVYLHGRSHKGMPVLWDVIGKVNLARANELNMDLALLTPYYVFFNECIWRVVLDKGENDDDRAQFITVEDVGGVRPWHLTPRVLSVLRSLTGTMKAHYIERCYKTYIINAPSAFTVLWRVVAPMLDSRTREKVSILGTNYLETMEKDIDISQIPPEYGGRSGRAIDDSDDERKILSLVARLNARGGGGKDGSTGDVEGLPKEGNDVPGKLELST